MKQFVTWLCVAWMGLTGAAIAQDRPVVVELFTSQGCSSCPPADAFLHKLAKRPDVIALALHVDYWDYIGWKDSFADPENTKRQRAYAHAAGRRSIYTPQMVINGQDHVVGNHSVDVNEVIRKRHADPDMIQLQVSRDGRFVVINAQANSQASARAAGPMVVHLVSFKPQQTVQVRRGENAGKSLSYANIVTDWKTLSQWDGQSALELRARAPKSQPVAVLVQAQGHGPILAAFQLP